MWARLLRTSPALVVVAVLLGACSSGGKATQTFAENGISFRYPEGWHVTGFSTSNSPRRLVVTTYPVPSDAVKGDCGGYEAVALLPPGGAFVLLVDYGRGRSFRSRPRTLTMRAGAFAEYECFGASTMFRFRLGKRNFQAHVAFGSQASDETQDRALAILTSVAVAEQPGFLLAQRNHGRPAALLAKFEGRDRQTVGFWDLHSDTAHYLGFQFGHWAVLVYDYVGAGAMTEAERASWSASFSGRETDEGFLLLEGSGPLRLARAGEHAGPQLTFAEGDPTRDFILFPGRCMPHRDQNRRVDAKLVQWSGGFADWCLSKSLRIHASGRDEFVGALIRGLKVRDVVLARR